MLRLINAVVVSVLLTATLQAQLLGEHAVSPIAYGPAPGWSQGIAAAFDGENFFALWTDLRAVDAIYAARVNEQGALVDQPTAIRVGSALRWNMQMVAVPDGYFVYTYEGTALEGALLSREGRLLVALHPVALVVSPMSVASAATNGRRIVLTAERGRTLILDLQGNFIEEVMLPVGVCCGLPPEIASNGDTFIAAWTETSEGVSVVKAMELDSTGHPLGQPSTVPMALTGGWLHVASNGADYLVTNAYGGAMSVRAVKRDGQVMGPEYSLEAGVISRLIGIPGGYVVAIATSAADGIAVNAIRLDENGRPGVVAAGQPIPGFSGGFEVAAGRSTFTVFTAGSQVRSTVIDSTRMEELGSALLTRSTSPQFEPSIAFSGRNYLVVWKTEEGKLIAGRVGLGGELLDGAGQTIATDGWSHRVLFDGEHYVIAWQHLGTLKAARLDPATGTVLDPSGVTIAEHAGAFDMTFDGQLIGFAFVTTLMTDGGMSVSISAARSNRALQLLDVRTVSPPSIEAGEPSIAGNGREWLVVFEEQFWNRYLQPGMQVYWSNVRAVRLSSLFTVLDPEPLTIATRADLETEYGPEAVAVGNDFVIDWTHSGSVSGYFSDTGQIRSRTLRADGLSDTTTILDDAELLDAVSTGTSQVVAYQTRVSTELREAGVIAGGNNIRVATSERFSGVSLAPSRPGTFVTAYSRLAAEPLYGGVFRVFVTEPATHPRMRAVRR